MSKFKKECKKYLKSCYGDNLHPGQEKECTQAFYAGGFISLNILINNMENPNIEKLIEDLYKELATKLNPGQAEQKGKE